MAEMDQDPLLGPSVGERLKAAREKRGLSLDEVASQTRIPIRHLQHIELGEWDALPAVTYSIGFTRAYANAVGLDGPAIGAELREQLGGVSHTSAAAPAYYEPADPARVPPRSLALLTACLFVLLAGGYLIWRNAALDDPATDESEIVAGPAAPADKAVPKQPPGTVPVANDRSGPVVLTATSDVWLRIYEGNGGRRLHEAILKAGESYTVPSTATAPQILTGRPNALRVTVGSTMIPQLSPAERTISDVSLLPADLLARANAGAGANQNAQPAAASEIPVD
ncbi:helix-turn-helix domain-containing protein [Sphingosinicella rhizophila]|uniref:DUF4115 domain-containing protein n=1 Tax=Sphingosinicella rhizophila TaxID=3050082 RepID=A0ABU3Q4H9_9SPHN|nr:RodZ domain-containing protein [Sphingosinicella sp. GR2756]MDT9598187.1 DUF4115 domain-containing protein [Sphingosinicella sp. GR2756]